MAVVADPNSPSGYTDSETGYPALSPAQQDSVEKSIHGIAVGAGDPGASGQPVGSSPTLAAQTPTAYGRGVAINPSTTTVTSRPTSQTAPVNPRTRFAGSVLGGVIGDKSIQQAVDSGTPAGGTTPDIKLSPDAPLTPTDTAVTNLVNNAATSQTGSTGSPGTGSSSTASPDFSSTEQTAISNINNDIARGQAYTTASGAFSPGAMGRVNSTTDAATADALAKAQGLEQGLSAPQMQAQKELNDQAIGGQLQSNLMALRGIQGAQGLRGGSAAAQQVGLLNTAGAQQQQAARQEELDQLAAQQAGVQNFLSDNTSNNAFNTANTQYNNQQANAEAAGRLSTPLTYAGLLQGARAGADTTALAQENAGIAKQGADSTAATTAAQLAWAKDPSNPANQVPPANGGPT